MRCSQLRSGGSTARRRSPLPPSRPSARRTDARAMGITGIVSSYTTTYGGVPNRIHNVEVVSHLVDDTLIPPGKEFSFNGTTGERNAAKGLLEAPVIINGELQNGLGGGTCQVSTTVFNAAYEAGLPITERAQPRALHQPLPAGPRRDGQLPGHRPQVRQRHRPLVAAPHVRQLELADGQPLRDAAAPAGRERGFAAADDRARCRRSSSRIRHCSRARGWSSRPGLGATRTSVTRRVYDEKGKLLYDNTWYSSYVGEKTIVRVGTKPKPKPVDPSTFLPPELVPGGTTTDPTTGLSDRRRRDRPHDNDRLTRRRAASSPRPRSPRRARPEVE